MAASEKATHSTTNVWLIGHILSTIDGPSQLPTSGVALCRVFYEMIIKKSTLSISCNTVADENMMFWFKANISTIPKPHVVAKLKSSHKQHVQVSKHRSRKSATQHSYQKKFTAKMNTLFDIAHGEWDCLIKINEDKQFLIDQRGPRKMLMTSEDLIYKKAVVKYRKSELEEKRPFQQHKESKIISKDTLMDCNSDYSLNENSDCDKSIQTQKAFNRPNNSKHSIMGTSHLSITISKRCILDN